jgi:hypothetical protein
MTTMNVLIMNVNLIVVVIIVLLLVMITVNVQLTHAIPKKDVFSSQLIAMIETNVVMMIVMLLLDVLMIG